MAAENNLILLEAKEFFWIALVAIHLTTTTKGS